MNEQVQVTAPPRPVLRAATSGDVLAALRAGHRDFWQAPLVGLVLGGSIALGGLVSLLAIVSWNMGWLAIFVAVVFPLVFPFLAAGLYETSRRLARGERPDISAVVSAMARQRERQLGWMAFVVLFVFWVWVYQVRILLALFFGFASANSGKFLMQIATTPAGWTFVTIGSGIGLAIALLLFAVTLLSMPILFETEVDFVTAMIASVQTVAKSALPLLGFGVLATAVTVLGIVPGFLGLFIIVPVLGHAAWHLYQRLRLPLEAPLS